MWAFLLLHLSLKIVTIGRHQWNGSDICPLVTRLLSNFQTAPGSPGGCQVFLTQYIWVRVWHFAAPATAYWSSAPQNHWLVSRMTQITFSFPLDSLHRLARTPIIDIEQSDVLSALGSHACLAQSCWPSNLIYSNCRLGTNESVCPWSPITPARKYWSCYLNTSHWQQDIHSILNAFDAVKVLRKQTQIRELKLYASMYVYTYIHTH